MPFSLARLDRTGQIYCPTIEQELFGQCRFTGVRMTYDAKRSTSFDFLIKTGTHYRKLSFAKLELLGMFSPECSGLLNV
jgi:hypothetical protein